MSAGKFEVRSAIPVLRILDEEQAMDFYVDFLGFEVEWEHRFQENTPLYAQVRLGDAVLHLNGHAEEDSPTTEVRIPVSGLADYCDYLRDRASAHTEPRMVDPRGTGEAEDMPIYDPFGNLLTFWKTS